MNEDIRYWRGKRIEQLSVGELREALVEIYRENERLMWLTHQQRMVIERSGKSAKAHRKVKEVEVDVEEVEA